ncbi:MAG: hypothetical protein EBR06_05285, partial [Acidimicrobiia bacterium]|nr:hypothetical protein [Acidimicrobiia bacterium]
RALGRERGVTLTPTLCKDISKVIGRTISKLDSLTKREASNVIEAWAPKIIPNEAGEIPDPIDEEPF